jgi:hypothetical protein
MPLEYEFLCGCLRHHHLILSRMRLPHIAFFYNCTHVLVHAQSNTHQTTRVSPRASLRRQATLTTSRNIAVIGSRFMLRVQAPRWQQGLGTCSFAAHISACARGNHEFSSLLCKLTLTSLVLLPFKILSSSMVPSSPWHSRTTSSMLTSRRPVHSCLSCAYQYLRAMMCIAIR